MKPRFQRDLDRIANGIAALRVVHTLIHGKSMAGEIRDAMAKLHASKKAMIADMLKEIDGVQGEIKATHADGMDAMKLPRAELEQTKAEIREIRAEFSQSSNGDPHPGPLPGQLNGSQTVSVPSSADEARAKIDGVVQSAEKKT